MSMIEYLTNLEQKRQNENIEQNFRYNWSKYNN